MSKHQLIFGATALLAVAAAAPACASDATVINPGTPVLGAPNIITNGTNGAQTPIFTTDTSIDVMYIGSNASIVDLLTMGTVTGGVYTAGPYGTIVTNGGSRPSGYTQTTIGYVQTFQNVPLGSVFAITNEWGDSLDPAQQTAPVTWVSGIPYSNINSNPATNVYHFAYSNNVTATYSNGVFTGSNIGTLFSGATITSAEDAYFTANGGYSDWYFVGVEDLAQANFDDWNDTVYAFRGVGTPEPSTWAMMAIGFASLAFAGYRAGKPRAATA